MLDELLTTALSPALLTLLLQQLLEQLNASASSSALCEFLQAVYYFQDGLQEQKELASHPLYRSLQTGERSHPPSL